MSLDRFQVQPKWEMSDEEERIMLTVFFGRVAAIACSLSLVLSASAINAAEPKAGQQKKVEVNYTQRTSTLIGTQVKNREGKEIGKIEDLLVDVRDGRLTYGILSFGGIFGIGDKLFPIPWRELTLRVEENKTFLVADVSKEFLEKAPGFARNEFPDVTPAWVAIVEGLFPVHAGRFVSVSKNHLVMTLGEIGETEHSHPVASNAVVTRDGEKSALTDLKKGDHIKVTIAEEAAIRVITRVDAQSARTTD